MNRRVINLTRGNKLFKISDIKIVTLSEGAILASFGKPFVPRARVTK